MRVNGWGVWKLEGEGGQTSKWMDEGDPYGGKVTAVVWSNNERYTNFTPHCCLFLPPCLPHPPCCLTSFRYSDTLDSMQAMHECHHPLLLPVGRQAFE